MKRKVTLAIFDNDLRLNIGKYELSKDGTRIIAKSGGTANWKPSFNNESFLEFPKPWYMGGGWKRIYFVKKKGAECVNFKTGEVSGPDEEELKEAIGAVAFKNLGKDDNTVTWVNYVTLAFAVLTFLVVSGLLR